MSPARKTGAQKPLATTAAKPAKKVEKKSIENIDVKGKKAEKITSTAKTQTTQTLKQTICIQHLGKEISYEEIVAKVKEVWISGGNKVSQIKTLDIYVKPEELASYYVINGDITGMVPM